MKNSHSFYDTSSSFFALTLLLSCPFYILYILASTTTLGTPDLAPLYIALFTIAPISSAGILTYKRNGRRGLKRLIYRIFDCKKITHAQWYWVIVCLSPLSFLVALVWLVLMGMSVPPALVPLVALPVLIPFFFLLAATEEVGWMGYAFESLQTKYSALQAATFLGLFWALWHVPFFYYLFPDTFDLFAQLLTLVATRILIAWIFIHSGKSVFAAILFHASSNIALMCFPLIKSVSPWGSVIYCGLTIALTTAALLFRKIDPLE